MIGEHDKVVIPGAEHQSVFALGHQDWREGTTCDECQALLAEKRNRGQQRLLVSGLATMRDREYESIQHAEKRMVAQARANGIEPERAP